VSPKEADALVCACREVVDANDIIDRSRSPTGGVPDYADMNWDMAVEQLREATRTDADERLAALAVRLKDARQDDREAVSDGWEKWPHQTLRVVEEFLVSEEKRKKGR